MSTQLHLDCLGGISGDMFIAAMLAVFPNARSKIDDCFQKADLADIVSLEIFDTHINGFAAQRAEIKVISNANPTKNWNHIREYLENSALEKSIKTISIAIFELLAKAEAKCHGVAVKDVHFHEIADWDSLADIVAAACLIDFTKAESWSVSALPLGKGRIHTRHGLVPLPAPATAELLKGYEFFTDEAEGERITPTGAAILAYLAPTQNHIGPVGALKSTGIGAGSKTLEVVANILRISQFETQASMHDQVALIEFEIDDMTPEELAIGLEKIRGHEAVLDVRHGHSIGKKNRMMFDIHILAKPDAFEAVAELCFAQTTTIGLRHQTITRKILPRKAWQKDGIGVKMVERPDGITRKAESDDLGKLKTLEDRRHAARKIEAGR